ncbi:MAG TPA: hypothetical protein VEB86_03255 [Chryseosolibacter sp.]|nr:hypothetical protein [Chryseosolibacter sp.]
MRIVFLLTVLVTFTAGAQVPGPPDGLVPVTVQTALGNKRATIHNYRIGVLPTRDSIRILVYGMNRLPRSLKQLKFTSKEKLNRSQVQRVASSSMDTVYRFLSDTAQELTFKIPSASQYLRGKTRFLAGKRSSSYFSSQWIRLASVPQNGWEISFHTRSLTRRHAAYRVDNIPGAMAWQLPALDPWNCVPAPLRFFNLRKLQGYGLDKIRHTRYTPNPRVIIRRSFNVYFAHNETVPDPGDIRNVEQYLKENNYVILSAELEGGCSIEGVPERNRFLQKARATVLQRALHKYSDELLKKDTVILTDFVVQFRGLIRNGPFASLDTLDDISLVARVNSDEFLRGQLEHLFAAQRKASLKLVMAKRLSRSEMFEKFIFEFQKVVNQLSSVRRPPADLEPRLMGMIERLFEEAENKRITEAELQQLIDQTSNPDYVRVLLGVHLLKKFELKSWPSNKSWAEYWREFNIGDFLQMAEENCIRIAERTQDAHLRRKYMGILVDLQAYTYHFVEIGLIDINLLCNIPYPETSLFMPLILSRYAYLFEAAQATTYRESHAGKRPVTCVPQQRASRYPRVDTTDTDKFLEQLEAQYGSQRYQLVGQKLVRQRSFNDEPKGAYYYLLKEYFLKKNKSPLTHVEDAATGGEFRLDVFNLWHLVKMNVDGWDPHNNYFFDRDVLLDELERLIAMLKQSDHGICRPQVNTLYLNYHLNVLYYLQFYAEPGNPKHEKYADNALKFIAGYYKSRPKMISPKLALHLVKQFNLLNWLPGRRAGAYYGYDLLNTIARVRELNEEEEKLYAHYLGVYDPQMKKTPVPVSKREKLAKLMDEKY